MLDIRSCTVHMDAGGLAARLDLCDIWFSSVIIGEAKDQRRMMRKFARPSSGCISRGTQQYGCVGVSRSYSAKSTRQRESKHRTDVRLRLGPCVEGMSTRTWEPTPDGTML
jgi:hypothetical protein